MNTHKNWLSSALINLVSKKGGWYRGSINSAENWYFHPFLQGITLPGWVLALQSRSLGDAQTLWPKRSTSRNSFSGNSMRSKKMSSQIFFETFSIEKKLKNNLKCSTPGAWLKRQWKGHTGVSATVRKDGEHVMVWKEVSLWHGVGAGHGGHPHTQHNPCLSIY